MQQKTDADQSKNFELLSLNYYRSDYANNDPFRRACKTFNECYQLFDFSGCKDVLKKTQTIFLNCQYKFPITYRIGHYNPLVRMAT